MMGMPSVMLHAQSADDLYPVKELKVVGGETVRISNETTAIPSGNYSGIAWIGGNKYLLISDKKVGTDAANTDSWQTVSIDIDASGKVTNIAFEGNTTLKNSAGQPSSRNDAEGIVFVPKADCTNGFDASEGGTVFISAESDQKILEYDLDGQLTGRHIEVPEQLGVGNIFGNYGFESLAYSPERRTFWTTTEQGLKSDVGAASSPSNAVPTLLRMVCFGEDLKMSAQYAYKTDAPKSKNTADKYAFGVPELVALPDGTLIVNEREFYVGSGLAALSSFVTNKLYRAYPSEASEVTFDESLKDLDESRFMKKELLSEWTTNISNIANYEGMCITPKVENADYNILLVNDSQNAYKGILGEYIRNMALTVDIPVHDSAAIMPESHSAGSLFYTLGGYVISHSASSQATLLIAKGKKFAANTLLK